MSVSTESRKKLVRFAIAICAMVGLFANWLSPSKQVADFVKLGMVVTVLLLMKYAAKWQLFRLPPWFPMRIPQVRAE